MTAEVANTILEQLGGHKFRVMTGARNFVATPNSLSFQLPGGGGFCKDSINFVRITLTPADEYDIEFARNRAGRPTIVHHSKGIYCDQLQEIFTKYTGLSTHL